MNRLIMTGIITIAILTNAPDAHLQKNLDTNQQSAKTQEVGLKGS